ncbi:cob(I)yrinic acid a,c-diamide adenosyltransferase [Anaeroselena agilis]|uniref:Cob(I)yrinic acid a,c-diamide adenosyltransferase n=1 Tax=Anaeroselena agilis TaxID=3063788 RepID=A0ABU3NY61_9FIRM|nr:cob(I)yrinic acid a,c-diamide adenosyltransferase [Selenomonadales bacterium 4137-cl]
MNAAAAPLLIYTGDGKGKTTAALGLAVAAAACGRRAVVVQFQKGGGYSGELFAQVHLPALTIRQFGHGCAIAARIKSGEATCRKCGECFRANRDPANPYAARALAYAAGALQDERPAVLVLDEISHALRRGLLNPGQVIALIGSRSPETTVVLTGRHMPDELIALADQVTYCRAVKHPMKDLHIDARRGVEY